MVGKDNPFKGARQFYVFYDSAQGIQESTPVMLNGYKIGQLRKLALMEDTRKVRATIEIFSGINIPSNSRIKIESELLGTLKLKLSLGNSKKMAEDGDTLLPEYAKDVMSMVNEKIAPIAAGADSLLSNLNALISRSSVKQTFDQLPQLVSEVNQTIAEIKDAIAAIKPGLNTSMTNLAAFSGNLSSYGKSLEKSLKSFEKLSTQLDSVQLNQIVTSLQGTVNSLGSITADIKAGKGSLGKLATDDALYNSLTQTTNSLQCLVNDLKNYPEKYIPLPWGKKQRKKAKEKSALNGCFPRKDSATTN